MKRYSSIDTMKAMAAFFIIFIHVPIQGILGNAFLPITRMAVPFFLMVSGFFLWSKDYKLIQSRIYNQIKKIFTIVVLSNLLYFLWNIAIQIIKHTSILQYFKDVFTIKNAGKFILLNESPFAGHIWYLGALLYVLIIYFFINKVKVNKLIATIIPILLLCDLIFGKYSIVCFGREFPFILVRNFIFVGIPYFMLGNIIRGQLENKGTNKRHNKVFLTGIVIFSITSILEKYILIMNNVNAIRDHYLSTTLLVICAFIYLVQNPELFKNSFLEKVGKDYSLIIYIIHPIIIFLLGFIVSKMGEKQAHIYSYFAVFIVFFISIGCSITLLKLKHIILSNTSRKNLNNVTH